MFEGIICSKPRAKDCRARGKMSGADGSNHLGKKAVPALRSEHLVSGRTRADRGQGETQRESSSREGFLSSLGSWKIKALILGFVAASGDHIARRLCLAAGCWPYGGGSTLSLSQEGRSI